MRRGAWAGLDGVAELEGEKWEVEVEAKFDIVAMDQNNGTCLGTHVVGRENVYGQ